MEKTITKIYLKDNLRKYPECCVNAFLEGI